MTLAPIVNSDVKAVFNSHPAPVREGLLELRQLVLETAEDTEGVGAIEETLKWGQPSYLTSETKSGSTIRVAAFGDTPGDYAMYFICNTNLVNTFEDMFGDVFTYEPNRALVFNVGGEIPRNELRQCISMALTYHRDKP